MRVGLCFDGFYSITEMVDLAQLADRIGMHSIWMSDHLCFRDSVASSTAFLAKTEKILVVPAPLTPYSRLPIISAMALATMDEFAPGRVWATTGTGNAASLAEAGAQVTRPLKTMREYMAVLRKLLSGETVDFKGEILNVNGAKMAFTPSVPLPIYMTAVKDGMLRLSGEIGDGALLSAGCAPAYIARCAREVGRGAERRDPALKKPDIGGFIATAVSADAREAIDASKSFLAYIFRNKHHADNIRAGGGSVDQEGLAAAIGRRDWEGAKKYISDDVVRAHSISGTPSECVKQLEKFVAAGLDLPILLPMGTPEGRKRAVELAKQL
jgi:5,10-methylenetetrahydromethanopterin reductase